MADSDVDPSPLYQLLIKVEHGSFYDDYDEAAAMLSAAWQTYFELTGDQYEN